MKTPLISVIIPGYNEEAIVARTIEVVEREMYALGRPFELLIVDDGSTDNTAQILEKMVREGNHPDLRFISWKDGPSRRENVAKSFRLLKGDFILLLDMDLSLDVKHFEQMLSWLEKGYELVIINRYHAQSKIRRHIKRYLISKIYNAVIRVLFRTGFKDNICGFKAFKSSVAHSLIDQAGIDTTGTRSVFWDTQLLIIAKRNGVRIKEIPAHWEESEKSSLNFRRESKMIGFIFRFWLQSVFRMQQKNSKK